MVDEIANNLILFLNYTSAGICRCWSFWLNVLCDVLSEFVKRNEEGVMLMMLSK